MTQQSIVEPNTEADRGLAHQSIDRNTIDCLSQTLNLIGILHMSIDGV